MTSADVNRRKLDLGRVFGDTFGVIRRQAGPLLGVTFVAGYLPSLVSAFLSRPMVQAAAQAGSASFGVFKQPLYWILTLVGLLLSSFLLACQFQISIGDLEGRPAPLPEVLRLAAGKMLPMLAAMVLMGVGLMIGTMLFVVPGIILSLMWAVTLPAVVGETANPIRALGRSRALTRGNRWRIFGLAILVTLVVFAFEAIVLGTMGGLRGVAALNRAGGPSIVSTIVLGLLGYAVYIVGSAGGAALYTQLRELKGEGGESVAQVFA